ncbi:Short-chain dehydrogenase/reductase family protein [Mycena indigotica]|uniref:Short-chain dehydrogenase/reductase family protein n=1 Tax=Mycena indigotica TaxID=2126181 RepID=A0A8H6S8H9_9AGAR|nr:Short-chain dehydrogenase/reductase family protein [Mycena indigotica]KAF7294950.1 Short-chain dehydrogenase/reductase family protein [Mycena indigotica]
MVFNASRLLGKTVLVTGSSAGIGKATAILFAKAGSNVILLARRAEALAEVKQACIEAHKASNLQEGGQFAAIPFDVSDRVAIGNLFSLIPTSLRNIDILVNNAGFVVGRDSVGDLDEKVVESMFATNVLGLISLTNLFVKDFKTRGTGHIINLGSVAGREPYAGGSIYTATKHAVNAFTASMMRELINTPIRVTEIQPGMVETEFSLVRFKGDADAAKAVYAGMEPLTGEDIAEEIVWAASRPPHVNIAETLIFPVNQASATTFYRAPA